MVGHIGMPEERPGEEAHSQAVAKERVFQESQGYYYYSPYYTYYFFYCCYYYQNFFFLLFSGQAILDENFAN